MRARQRYGDDPELTRATRSAVLHVVVALAVAVLAVVASFALIFGKFLFFTRQFQLVHGWGLVAVVAVVLLLTVRAFRRSDRPVLVPRDARTVDDGEQVAALLARLCALADLPVPRLVEVDLGVRNAFVVQASGEPVTLCVSRRAIDELPADQLEAVLAHELFHVAHGDTALVRRLEHVARTVDDRAPSFVADFVLSGVRRMERQRELSADRAAALLTGRPAALVGALDSCAPGSGDIPLRDLRATLLVAFVAAPGAAHGGPHDTHPSVGERTEVLARAAAQLGGR